MERTWKEALDSFNKRVEEAQVKAFKSGQGRIRSKVDQKLMDIKMFSQRYDVNGLIGDDYRFTETAAKLEEYKRNYSNGLRVDEQNPALFKAYLQRIEEEKRAKKRKDK